MPGWVIALVIIEVIQQFLAFLDLVLGTLGIRFRLEVIMEKLVIE